MAESILLYQMLDFSQSLMEKFQEKAFFQTTWGLTPQQIWTLLKSLCKHQSLHPYHHPGRQRIKLLTIWNCSLKISISTRWLECIKLVWMVMLDMVDNCLALSTSLIKEMNRKTGNQDGVQALMQWSKTKTLDASLQTSKCTNDSGIKMFLLINWKQQDGLQNM